jgi:hypothetical protein
MCLTKAVVAEMGGGGVGTLAVEGSRELVLTGLLPTLADGCASRGCSAAVYSSFSFTLYCNRSLKHRHHRKNAQRAGASSLGFLYHVLVGGQ